MTVVCFCVSHESPTRSPYKKKSLQVFAVALPVRSTFGFRSLSRLLQKNFLGLETHSNMFTQQTTFCWSTMTLERSSKMSHESGKAHLTEATVTLVTKDTN